MCVQCKVSLVVWFKIMADFLFCPLVFPTGTFRAVATGALLKAGWG